jgi:hypothetical protein
MMPIGYAFVQHLLDDGELCHVNDLRLDLVLFPVWTVAHGLRGPFHDRLSFAIVSGVSLDELVARISDGADKGPLEGPGPNCGWR